MWFRILPLQACLSASGQLSCQLSMVAQDTKHVKQNFRVVWRGGETINNSYQNLSALYLNTSVERVFKKSVYQETSCLYA